MACNFENLVPGKHTLQIVSLGPLGGTVLPQIVLTVALGEQCSRGTVFPHGVKSLKRCAQGEMSPRGIKAATFLQNLKLK